MPETKNLSPAEKWESLTFANNFIFCKVLEDNPDITKEILELLLDIQIDHIEQPASQKEVCVVHSDGNLSAGPSLALSSKI